MTMSIVAGLLKVATKLSKGDERKQMVQFGALGAAAYPGVTAAGNLIQSGKAVPSGVSPKRWLASQVLKGTLVGGAIPAARHFIGRGNLETARRRVEAEREMKALVPGGVQGVREAVQKLPMHVPTSEAIEDPSVKIGASKIVARLSGNLKSRKGRRPMRVETLLKKGSQSGADLRLPVMGGTKFPTGDSLSQAKATLKEHQNVAKPKMVQPKVQPVQGVPMPKFGSVDPLVEYLKKTAQGSKVDSEGKLEDNEGDMKTAPEEQARVDACPFASQRGGDKTHSEWRSQLNEMFSHKEGITKKYLDKESVAKGPK